ncbi:MAG: NAD(P)/FAD-dependent oxidoreductase [Hyphomicrobiales bacterium]
MKRVVVIGTGVVGLATAHYLLERGHAVTLVERGGPDRDCCSLGNAGFISPSHFVPLASPGIVRQALAWMRDPESPFFVHARPSPRFLGWAWRFWRATAPERARRAEPLLRDLALRSRALFEELAASTGNEFLLQEEGLLVLVRTEKGLRHEARLVERSVELGMPARLLDAAGVAALEPGLTLDVRGGGLYTLDAHVTPQRFVAALLRRVTERGGRIEWNAEARGFRTEGRRVRAVLTDRGAIEGDELVLAAGSWTGLLARRLGLALPLEPGKGYSMTLEAPREMPRRSIILNEARVAVTPMGGTVRVGGTMELGGFDLSISPPRIRGIVRSLTRYLTGFRPEDFERAPRWCGLRPLSPDGLPYVGRTRRYENVSVATGHAMMGFGLGPVTGLLIAQSLSGETPDVALEGLDPDRYA